MSTLQAEIVMGRKSCKSCKIFLAILIQKVADIKCCWKSFSKKLQTLNVVWIHFPKKAASNKCHDEVLNGNKMNPKF